MPKPNTMDDWIESLEKMFPVNTGDKQLDFANANKILGIREIADQLTAKLQEVDRAARIDELNKFSKKYLAGRDEEGLGWDMYFSDKQCCPGDDVGYIRNGFRKELRKDMRTRLDSLKGGDV